MVWDAKFTRALQQGTEAPSFIVQTIGMAEPIGSPWRVRGPYSPNVLAPGIVDQVEISGARVSTDSWSATTGGITITLIGNVEALLLNMRRGQLVQVLAGFSSLVDADYATIALGQVNGFTRRGNSQKYTLTLRDIWSALSSRFSTTPDELALFTGLPVTTVLKKYKAGDSTIDLALSTEMPKETGGDGALEVTDDGGNIFYVTWTGPSTLIVGGRRYTIVTAGALSTLDADAGVGNQVRAIAYVKDEPVDIIRKILASTGIGDNGAYDTLPKLWGYGIPDAFLDHDDLDDTRDFTRTGNPDHDWEAWSAEPQENGLSWVFGEVFQAGGFFPLVHQGGMSVRSGLEPYNASVNLAADEVRADIPYIDDQFLARDPLDRWESWSPDHAREAYRFLVFAGASSIALVEPVNSMPSTDTVSVDLTPWVHNNKAQHLAAVAHRLHMWSHRTGERFTIRMPNLELVSHAIGGLTRLSSLVLRGRTKETFEGFFSVPILVTQVSIDWRRRTMSMSFEVLPKFADKA